MTLTTEFNPNTPVPFSRMRYMMQESGGGLQAGVIGATDLMVVQRGAGANMSVDVGGGGAWVAVNTGTRNGLAHCFNDAVANVAITAANATNPRIDQIYLRYNDSSIPTGSGDIPTLAVATGTATAGATLTNRTGAAALPNDCLRLADVLVPALDTTIDNTQIRDRRPWARGASWARLGDTSGAHATASTTPVTLAAGYYDARLECSGVPLDLEFSGNASHTATGGIVVVRLLVDGVLQKEGYLGQAYTTSGNYFGSMPATISPAVGSRLFAWQFYVITAGTGNIANSGGLVPLVRYREIVRQTSVNNSVTSG